MATKKASTTAGARKNTAAKPRKAVKSGNSPTARKSTTTKATNKAPAKTSTATKASRAKAAGKESAAKATAKKATAKTSSAPKSGAKKFTGRKYSPAAAKQVGQELHEMHRGQLTIGRSNKKVTNPKQAIAIGLSEARRAGKKVPPNPNDPKKK